MASKLKLIVAGEEIHTNEFVENIFRDIILAMLRNLRDVGLDEISRIEIS